MGKINASHSSYCYDSTLLETDESCYPHRGQSGKCCCIVGKNTETWIQDPCCGERSKQEQESLVAHTVLQVDERCLVYRAEGNANIVLSLSDNKHVLRLRKSKIATRDGKAESNVKLDRFVKYSEVMSNLFSSCYVPTLQLAHLNTSDLDAFNKRLSKARPVSRQDKEIRELDGIIFPDVAFLPAWLYPAGDQDIHQEGKIHSPLSHYQTYCVEIKPKQGWYSYEFCDNIPAPGLASVGDGDLRKCRYCFLQYLKLQQKSIAKISKYCPLDLFSGKPIRVLQAVKGLIGAPQNNFKLLKNGKIVYDETREKSAFNRILKEMFPRDGRTKEERKNIFLNLIKEVLLKDFSTSNADGENNRKLLTIRKDRKKKDKNQLHERCCNGVGQNFLPERCVLREILDVQSLVKSNFAAFDPSQLASSSSSPCSYVDDMYEKYLDYRDDVGYSDASMMSGTFCSEYLSTEEKYQFGATALDCSVMITFRRLAADRALEDRLSPEARNHIIVIEGMKFLVKVTITDLDPKSHKHHQKYVDQLAESAMAYRDFMSKLMKRQ
ncbi:inositol-pentakisphosphate 2-kinase [Anopheles darlingi]|uniref:inositol-pentakisphosphate 2-kinase n=1 Tax=Anopheles darlingi TaxID=43151 RepID=UPI00210059C8|nr:inositol-pentakisphosphate 2-kinase [Anopheles darlingi]